MRNLWPVLVLAFVLFVASAGYGAIPPMNVTVSDAGGKIVFKGTTSTTGTFATGKLRPGNYVVQFNATIGTVKGKHYTIDVSGANKVSAADVPGEKFAGSGVAMKITVGTPIDDVLKKHPGLNNPAAIRAMERDNREANLNITGHVATAP